MSASTKERSFRPDRTKTVTGARMRSVRGYRRRLDALTAQAMRGEIPWGDVRAAAAAIKAGAEMLMAEQLLAHTAGGDQEVPDHPLGDAGGLEGDQRALVHKRKKVKVKSGIDKRGNRIDEKSVEVETSADDLEAIPRADIESLMD